MEIESGEIKEFVRQLLGENVSEKTYTAKEIVEIRRKILEKYGKRFLNNASDLTKEEIVASAVYKALSNMIHNKIPETKNIDKPQADLLNIDQIFEACFLRNQGEHTPYLVISSNLKPAFRERIAKEVVRIIDCETSI